MYCKRFFYKIFGLLLFFTLASIGYAEIPDFLSWHHYFEMPDTIDSTEIEPDIVEAFDITADDEGNIYVSGVARYEPHFTVRILQKYEPDGTPIYGYEGSGTPWWNGDHSAEYIFPWHKLLIDNENEKIYVLFACNSPVDPKVYSFVLSCHDIESGENVWSVGIGASRLLRAGIDIDSDGNVWTIFQQSEDCFKVEKWSGSGTFIQLANNGLISYRDQIIEFQAFGLKSDNEFYLAFRMEEPETVDLAVTLWNIDSQNLQFLGRQNFTFEIPEQADNYTCWVRPDPDARHHPFFTDGYTDEDGNFLVAGFYSYRRRAGGPTTGCDSDGIYVRNYPVLVKLDSELNKVFEYIEMEYSMDHRDVYGDLHFEQRYPFVAKVLPKNNSGALICISGDNSMIYEIDNDGNRIDMQRIIWYEFLNIPPESECQYWKEWYPRSFVYIPSTYSEKIVVTGPVSAHSFNSSSCLPTQQQHYYDQFLTISYSKLTSILVDDDDYQRRPEWFNYYYLWKLTDLQLFIDPPGPVPDPIPWVRMLSGFEFGAHGGVLLPSGNGGDTFSTSFILGANILAHMPMFAIEGSISYSPLSTDAGSEYTDYSASMIPILAGIRTYSGPIFYGGGIALDISSVSYESSGVKYDNTDSEFGAYGNVGVILPTGSMDVEASLKYHFVDFDFDAAWLGLTAGINF